MSDRPAIYDRELVIDDDTPLEVAAPADCCRGLVPRPAAFTSGALRPFDIPLIPRHEWPERIREMEAKKTRLSDIIRQGNAGRPIPSKQQNEGNGRWGYCWAYAVVGAVEALRAVMNQPYVPLSAFGVAYTIKNGRDEGAWGALALDFALNRGIPPETVWPNFSRQVNPNDPRVWQEAARFRVDSAWMDLSRPVWDRDLTFDQKATLLLNRIPVVDDFLWWGHAVYSCDLVDVDPRLDLRDPNRWGVRIRNSWGDGWGDIGFGIVRGRRAIPDNAVAPRRVPASV